MGDISILKGATAKLGRVEGDLRIGQGERAESEGAVIEVTGRVICEGEAEFQGSLSCSEFSARGAWGSGGKIKILGDLKASGEVRVENGQLSIDGSLDAASVNIDKALWVGGNARADDFDVGGVLEVRGNIMGKKVDVGGSVDIAGLVRCSQLDVGGMARIGGGEVSKDVDVGGKFESTKPLKF